MGQPCVIIVGWVWTSFMRQQHVPGVPADALGLRRLHLAALELIDWIQILGGATINTLLLLRDYAPDAIIVYAPSPPPPSSAIQRRTSEGPAVPDSVGERGLHNGACPFDALQDVQFKANRGNGGETLALVGETGRARMVPTNQRDRCAGHVLRLLYFFRGNLRLGALTHTFSNIVNDIIPLIFLIVFIIGFTASMMVLVMHELNHSHYPGGTTSSWRFP